MCIRDRDRVLGGADTWATSQTIAGALRNLEYDLIITGRQAIDGDTAQVGPQISEHLNIPVISYAQNLKVEDVYKRQVYHRDGINGDYDDYDDVDQLMNFILTGVR